MKPAVGYSGGMLIAVRKDLFEFQEKDQGEFYVSLVVRDLNSSLNWEVIIYGPVALNRKDDFFAEITDKVLRARLPVCLGGDFNVVRYEEEKSCGFVHRSLMYKFNVMINLLQLRELHRSGCKFTWTNKQVNPTMEVLDRVL